MQNTAAVWVLQQCKAVPWAGGAQVQHPCARGGWGPSCQPPPTPCFFPTLKTHGPLNTRSMLSTLHNLKACWRKHVGASMLATRPVVGQSNSGGGWWAEDKGPPQNHWHATKLWESSANGLTRAHPNRLPPSYSHMWKRNALYIS